MSCSLPSVPHQMPASLAWSLGWRLFRKWHKWVVIGSKIDSGGVWNKMFDSSTRNERSHNLCWWDLEMSWDYFLDLAQNHVKSHVPTLLYLLINYETDTLHLVRVLPVPLVQQVDIIAHGDQGLPQHLQLCRVDLWGDGAVAISRRFCCGYSGSFVK